MNYRQYLDNPSGKSSAMNNRIIYNSLIDMLNKYLANEKQIRLFFSKWKGKYYAHAQVQSRKLDRLFYDVVFEFTPNINSAKIDENYDMRIYTNSPSFNYTFAHVFIKRDLIIKSTVQKYDKMVRREIPEVKNPYMSVGYDRIVVFALVYILRKRGFDISKYVDRDMDKILKDMKNPNQILDEYDRLNVIRKKEKEELKKREEIQKKREAQIKENKERYTSKSNTRADGSSRNKIVTGKKPKGKVTGKKK